MKNYYTRVSVPLIHPRTVVQGKFSVTRVIRGFYCRFLWELKTNLKQFLWELKTTFSLGIMYGSFTYTAHNIGIEVLSPYLTPSNLSLLPTYLSPNLPLPQPTPPPNYLFPNLSPFTTSQVCWNYHYFKNLCHMQ